MDILHLTAPSGRPVSLIQSQIVQLREPLPNEMDSRAKTVVVLSSGFQAVRETIAEVEARFK